MAHRLTVCTVSLNATRYKSTILDCNSRPLTMPEMTTLDSWFDLATRQGHQRVVAGRLQANDLHDLLIGRALAGCAR
jgi:hypothetical protein